MKVEANSDLESFDDLLPEGQQWFSPKEVGEIIGRSDQFVRNSFHSGKIMGHVSNGVAAKGNEKRVYMRVHKKMLKLYLLETANYTSTMFMETLKEVIANCSDYQLLVIEKYIKDILYGGGRRHRR